MARLIKLHEMEIIEDLKDMTYKEIANKYKICEKTVYNIVKKYKNSNNGIFERPKRSIQKTPIIESINQTNKIKQIEQPDRSKQQSGGRKKNDLNIELIPANTPISEADKHKWDRLTGKSSNVVQNINNPDKKIDHNKPKKVLPSEQVDKMIEGFNSFIK